MSSCTFTLTGNSSSLSCSIFPEIELDADAEYSCALLDFTSYHSIPNVNEANNKVEYFINGTHAEFRIPPGCYEALEILEYIKLVFAKLRISFEYSINKNTFITTLACSSPLYTGDKNSANILNKIFGYKAEKTIVVNIRIESSDPIKIACQDVVRVECNIATGSYVNGHHSHAIYEFATNRVEAGYKIIERPRNLIYLPVAVRRLNRIEISFVDQNSKPIDFRGETVTCRIHIKKE